LILSGNLIFGNSIPTCAKSTDDGSIKRIGAAGEAFKEDKTCDYGVADFSNITTNPVDLIGHRQGIELKKRKLPTA